MQILEAVVCFKPITMQAKLHRLARVDGVDGIEHKLLSILGMGRHEVSGGPWQQVASHLARVHQLASTEQ